MVAPLEQQAQQATQAQRGGIGQRVVVGDMRLGDGQALKRSIVTPCGQHAGQVAHQRAIASVAGVVGACQRAFVQVAQDATAAGVAAVHRPAFEPAHIGITYVAHQGVVTRAELLQCGAAPLQQRAAQGQAHGGVVGDLAPRQVQPAAANDVAVYAVLDGDLARAHEFDRGPQRVANGKPEVGTQSPVKQFTHNGPPRHSRHRGPAPLVHLA